MTEQGKKMYQKLLISRDSTEEQKATILDILEGLKTQSFHLLCNIEGLIGIVENTKNNELLPNEYFNEYYQKALHEAERIKRACKKLDTHLDVYTKSKD